MQNLETSSSNSDLLARLEKQGEVLFGSIAHMLNRLEPERERTEEEFRQVCIALAMFVHHLLAIDEPDDTG